MLFFPMTVGGPEGQGAQAARLGSAVLRTQCGGTGELDGGRRVWAYGGGAVGGPRAAMGRDDGVYAGWRAGRRAAADQ
jgi:hypothetical protein